MRAEQLTEPLTYHGEGPVWSENWGGLRWVDMLDGDILTMGPDSRIQRRHVDDIAALVRPRRGGGAVLAIERGFALEEPDGTITKLGDPWSGDDIRMNEGGCDPDGRVYCGSMAYDKRRGGGSLYRLDPDGSVQRMLAPVAPTSQISNSGWSGPRTARRWGTRTSTLPCNVTIPVPLTRSQAAVSTSTGGPSVPPCNG